MRYLRSYLNRTVDPGDHQRTIRHTGYLEPQKSVSYLLERVGASIFHKPRPEQSQLKRRTVPETALTVGVANGVADRLLSKTQQLMLYPRRTVNRSDSNGYTAGFFVSGFSRKTPVAFLSSRNPRKTAWRNRSSLVHSVNFTSQTTIGFTQMHRFISAAVNPDPGRDRLSAGYRIGKL
jgi:hypothetical protein